MKGTTAVTGSKWIGFGLIAAVTAALALVLASAVSAQAPTVMVGSPSINIGENGTVDVQALDIPAPGLGGWTLDVTYDPAVVTVLGCTSAAGLCNPNFAANTVRVTGFNASGMTGAATLATIEMQCGASAGSSALTLTVVDFLDATPGAPAAITAAVQNGTVTCTTPSAASTSTPTPSPSPSPGALGEEQTPSPAAAGLPTAGGLPPASGGSTLWAYLLMGAGALALLAGGALGLKTRQHR